MPKLPVAKRSFDGEMRFYWRLEQQFGIGEFHIAVATLLRDIDGRIQSDTTLTRTHVFLRVRTLAIARGSHMIDLWKRKLINARRHEAMLILRELFPEFGVSRIDED